MKKERKTFSLLIGVGVLGFVIFSILHNVFYALAVITEENLILTRIMDGLHATSFLAGVILSPIIFLVGVIRAIMFNFKK